MQSISRNIRVAPKQSVNDLIYWPSPGSQKVLGAPPGTAPISFGPRAQYISLFSLVLYQFYFFLQSVIVWSAPAPLVSFFSPSAAPHPSVFAGRFSAVVCRFTSVDFLSACSSLLCYDEHKIRWRALPSCLFVEPQRRQRKKGNPKINE